MAFKIICIILVILLPVLTLTALVLYFSEFQALNDGMAFGTLGVTVLVFAVLAFFLTRNASDSGDDKLPLIKILIFCLLMIVVPIRAFMVGAEIDGAYKHVEIKMNDFNKGGYNSWPTISMEFTNNTGRVVEQIGGELIIYDGERQVGAFILKYSNDRIEDGESRTCVYELKNGDIKYISNSNLRIVFLFNDLDMKEIGGINGYQFDAVEVGLN